MYGKAHFGVVNKRITLENLKKKTKETLAYHRWLEIDQERSRNIFPGACLGKEGVKGIIPVMESKLSALSDNMAEGSLNDFQGDSVIIGKELSKTLGTFRSPGW